MMFGEVHLVPDNTPSISGLPVMLTVLVDGIAVQFPLLLPPPGRTEGSALAKCRSENLKIPPRHYCVLNARHR